MKVYAAILFIVSVSLMACQQEQNKVGKIEIDSSNVHVQRYGSITGLKSSKLSYYTDLHAHVWPGVLKKIKECNIRNYSIYIQKIDTSYYLFSYFEYIGNNFKGDMAKMAADTTTQRWWKETDPCQIPLSKAVEKGEIWANMREVFHED